MATGEEDKDSVASILGEAMAAVDAAGLPAQMREIAFSRAVDVIMARRTGETTARMEMAPESPSGSLTAMAEGRPAATDAPLSRIATRLRLDRDTVAEVFDEVDGKIDIIVPQRKLASGKSPATKQLATLVAAARQGADIEDWTDADEIRRFVEDFKRYDSANFAASLKEMDDIFRIKQSGRKITLKLGRPGWDKAAELVATLAGET